jgi:RNA dependent RNA polymerase
VRELDSHLQSQTASSSTSSSSSEGGFSSAATAAVAAALHKLSLNDIASSSTAAVAAAADDQHVLIQRVFVTPLRVCMLAPEQEGLNRVLRQYKQFSYRFLRVTFRSVCAQYFSV